MTFKLHGEGTFIGARHNSVPILAPEHSPSQEVRQSPWQIVIFLCAPASLATEKK